MRLARPGVLWALQDILSRLKGGFLGISEGDRGREARGGVTRVAGANSEEMRCLMR